MKKVRFLVELVGLIVISTAMLLLKLDHYLIMVVAIIPIAVFSLLRKDKLSNLGITTKRILPAIAIQLPFTIIGIVGLIIFASVNNYAISAPNLQFLTYWLISVPMQEFIFRGYMQRVFREFLPAIGVAGTAGALFALSHYFEPHAQTLMVGTFIAGLAWGWAYEKERNIIGPIFSHLILGSLIFLILP